MATSAGALGGGGPSPPGAALPDADDRKENIQELIRFAETFTDTTEFLEHVALVQATDTSKKSGEEDEPLVHLTTIHLAKGLEFDRVFIAGATEGILPHARSFGTQKELEEERRLMYVAMTRARHELSISFYDIPSRFLSDIPQELLQFETASGDTDVSLEDEERYITLE